MNHGCPAILDFKNGFFGTDITMDVTWILQTGDRLSIAVAVFLYSIVKPQLE